MGIEIDLRTEQQKTGVVGPSKAVKLRMRSCPSFETLQFIEVFWLDGKGNSLGRTQFSYDEWLAFVTVFEAGLVPAREKLSVLFTHEGKQQCLEVIAKARKS